MTSNFDDEKTQIAEINPEDLVPNRKRDNSEACLVQYSGDSIGKRYKLSEKELILGRSAEVEITIDEKSVSRKHAQIQVDEENVFIQDLGSANGTFVNDKLLFKNDNYALKDQDMIRMGSILLKFFSDDNWDGYIQDKIYKMATIDGGTNIFNKQYLLDALDTQFKISQTNGQELAIIYFDLDHFKKVNDNYGHNAGDQLLKELADMVKEIVRKDDIFGRFGGEEFVILLPKTDLDTAYEMAERIRKTCEETVYKLDYEKGGKPQTVDHKQTLSVGISVYETSMEIPKNLLESADQKLYHSKDTGRNKITK